MSRLRDRLPVRIAVGFVGGVATVAVAMLVAAMRQHDGNSADKLHRSTTLIAVIGLVAAVALGVAAAVAITRPVRRTIEAARRFGAGELDVRLPTRGSTELAELSTAFNAMTTRLADTLRDLHVSQTLQQRFVADVSHELRTPLAAVIAAAEGLDAEDPRARQRSTELVRGQVRRLGKLVDDLLEMSRFDAGQVPMVYERIDVTALAVDVVHTVWPGEDVRITPLGDTRRTPTSAESTRSCAISSPTRSSTGSHRSTSWSTAATRTRSWSASPTTAPASPRAWRRRSSIGSCEPTNHGPPTVSTAVWGCRSPWRTRACTVAR